MDMMWLRENSCRMLRLIAVILLGSLISPAPEALTNRANTFASLLSPIPGQIQLIIRKSRSDMTLYKGDTLIKTYQAVFGRGHRDGDKKRMGDKRTPEGEFYICVMNHSKRFYRFMASVIRV